MVNALDPPGERTVVTTLSVRYPETDRMGVAYHAHYLVWFELGRTELMRAAGCPYGEMEDRDGLFFPVIQAGIRYHTPARYDERLAVGTRLAVLGRARVRFEYRLMRDHAAPLVASGFTEHAAVGRDGKPRRMPAELAQRLADWSRGA